MKPISLESLQLKNIVFGHPIRDSGLKKFPCVCIHGDEDIHALAWWLQKNFENNWIWSAPPASVYVYFYFIHSEDALVFKLRCQQTT